MHGPTCIFWANLTRFSPQFMVVMHAPCGNVPALEFVDNMKKGGLFIIGATVEFGLTSLAPPYRLHTAY